MAPLGVVIDSQINAVKSTLVPCEIVAKVPQNLLQYSPMDKLAVQYSSTVQSLNKST